MHRAIKNELHSQIKAALTQLDAATLRELAADELSKSAALDIAADAVTARLTGVAGVLAGFGLADAAESAEKGVSDLRGEISTGEKGPTASKKGRTSRRVDLGMTAGLRRSGASFTSGPVLDLSTHGFRMETHLYVEVGTDLWLRLPGLEARRARVAWVRGPVIGCAFEEPLHEAVLDLIVRKAREG